MNDDAWLFVNGHTKPHVDHVHRTPVHVSRAMQMNRIKMNANWIKIIMIVSLNTLTVDWMLFRENEEKTTCCACGRVTIVMLIDREIQYWLALK